MVVTALQFPGLPQKGFSDFSVLDCQGALTLFCCTDLFWEGSKTSSSNPYRQNQLFRGITSMLTAFTGIVLK